MFAKSSTASALAPCSPTGRAPAATSAAQASTFTLPATIIQREFDAASFGVLIGLSWAISQFTYAFGPGLLGVVRDATGGYTVPPDFYQQLLTIMAESTFIRPRAFVVPMGSATMMMPYLDVTTVPTASQSRFLASVVMNWTAEAQTRTETEPKFKQMELKAWELSGYSVSSNVLLQDSAIGLEKFLFTLFGTAIGWYEEFAFLQGNGAGKPQGMLGCNAAIAVNRSGGANTVVFADVAKMWSKLLPVSWGKAIWTCSPSVIPQLLQLTDGANRAIFLQIGSPSQGAITSAPNWQLLGRPLWPTEKELPPRRHRRRRRHHRLLSHRVRHPRPHRTPRRERRTHVWRRSRRKQPSRECRPSGWLPYRKTPQAISEPLKSR